MCCLEVQFAGYLEPWNFHGSGQDPHPVPHSSQLGSHRSAWWPVTMWPERQVLSFLSLTRAEAYASVFGERWREKEWPLEAV